MTASAIKELRITEFSLALLEGTGWYQADYTMAEPITYGKNKGCNFLNTKCIDGSFHPTFEEFCSPLASEGCSRTYRGIGYCATTTPKTDATLNANFNYWGSN